jgi:hypothetical protein
MSRIRPPGKNPGPGSSRSGAELSVFLLDVDIAGPHARERDFVEERQQQPHNNQKV